MLIIAGAADLTYAPFAPALVTLLSQHGAEVDARIVASGHEIGERRRDNRQAMAGGAGSCQPNELVHRRRLQAIVAGFRPETSVSFAPRSLARLFHCPQRRHISVTDSLSRYCSLEGEVCMADKNSITLLDDTSTLPAIVANPSDIARIESTIDVARSRRDLGLWRPRPAGCQRLCRQDPGPVAQSRSRRHRQSSDRHHHEGQEPRSGLAEGRGVSQQPVLLVQGAARTLQGKVRGRGRPDRPHRPRARPPQGHAAARHRRARRPARADQGLDRQARRLCAGRQEIRRELSAPTNCPS